MEPDEAIDALSDLVDMIDEDVPSHAWDKAGEFFEDVRERANEMSDTIQESDEVSEAQESAITNWTKGVKKWIHN